MADSNDNTFFKTENGDMRQEDQHDAYQRPSGTQRLSAELQEKLNRMHEEPLIVALMEARPATVAAGIDEVDVIVTGLIMGGYSFYSSKSGFPDNYKVMIDDALPVREVQMIDPITVRLVISTKNAKPGAYDITFANDLGETLTGLQLLHVVA